MNKKVILFLAVSCGCEYTYIVGVSTTIPLEQKSYVLYIVVVGSPVPFREAVSFFFYGVQCECGNTNAILRLL